MSNARRPRRAITIGHSYCVALNRRLAHELARVGGEGWEVTAVAPSYFHGDLRPVPLEPDPSGVEPCRLEAVPLYGSKRPHVMLYGRRLRTLLRGRDWDVVHAWEEPYIPAGGQIAWWAPRGSATSASTSSAAIRAGEAPTARASCGS